MKSIFSQISKLSFFNHVMRLAMTVFVLSLAVTATASDTWNGSATITAKVSATGHGKVYAEVKENVPQDRPADDSDLWTSNTGSKSKYTYSSVKNGIAKEDQHKLHANADPGYYLAGWYMGDYSTSEDDLGYAASTSVLFEPSVKVSDTEGKEKTVIYTAVFKQQHIVNKSTLVAVATNSYIDLDNGIPMGYVYVSTNPNESDDRIDQTNMPISASNEYVDGPIDYVTYYYYAKPVSDMFRFKGWSKNADGSGELLNGLPYEQPLKAASEPPAVNRPQELYAVFEINPTFYYEGPTADFATNYSTPRGQVYCDVEGKYYSDQMNLPWKDNKWTEDEQDYYTTPKGATEYYLYYYAKPAAGYSFKGWSTTRNGSNILSSDPIYRYRYTTISPDGSFLSSMSSEYPDPSYTLYAVFEAYFYNSPAVVVADNSLGLGKIALKTNESYPTQSSDWKDAITERVKSNVPTETYPSGYTYNYYYYLKPELGAIFEGWSLTADGSSIIDIATTPSLTQKTVDGKTYYQGTYTTKVTDEQYPYTPPTLYAVFSSLLDIKQQDRMIFYRDDQGNGYINDANLLIELSDAATLTATLVDDGQSRQYFQLFNETMAQKGYEIVSDATTGLIQLRLNYRGSLSEALEPTAKTATIVLTGKDRNGKVKVSRELTITIEESPIVTFIPTDGKGEYTITHTDGSGIHYTMLTNQSQNIQVPITHENMAFMELNLTADITDDFEFYGWQVYENYGQENESFTYIAKEKLCTYRFNKAVTVKPEFIPTTWARYIIKSNPDVPYYDFAQVLQIAEDNIGDGSEYPDNKVIVVLPKKGENRLPLGSYTIPEGVSVLVPGDANYKILTTLGTNDYTTTGCTKGAYCTWTIESGTRIDVKGTLYIYSFLTSSGTYARPYQYGHIVLEDHCQINLSQTNAKLCAYGYISGSPSSSIVAQEGTTVYETFQICDWRGGNATADMVLENFNTDSWLLQEGIMAAGSQGYGDGKPSYQGVFPANHYYIQNIEIPITFESGAEEKLSAGVYVGSLNVVESPFIGVDKGLFRLKSNATLTKYYDVATDRMKFVLEGEEDDAKLDLGNLTLEASIIEGVNITVDTKEYNLPIPENYDISIKNLDMKIMYDILMLPGATINVDQSSVVTIDGGGELYDRFIGVEYYVFPQYEKNVRRTASVYVLDREWYNRNYYGAVAGKPQYEVINVGYRPGGAAIASRTIDSDAKVVVDGKIILVENNGYIYTTSTTAADKSNYGANITSNGGGSIQFANAAPENVVLQATQNNTDISYVELPITMAKLCNANGTYVSPSARQTYYYCDGTWSLNQCSNPYIPVIDNTPYFTAETVDFTNVYVGEGTANQVLDIENQNNKITSQEWATITWTGNVIGRDKNLFTFKTDANGKNPSVDFTPASSGNKNALLLLTATFTKNTEEFTYTQPIVLTGNALNQLPNQLAFADLTRVYVGQSSQTALFANAGSGGSITLIIKDKDGNVVDPTAMQMNIANSTLASATIQPASTANTDTFTIEAIQVANNHIQPKTIQTDLIINPLLVWNWSELYYPSVNTNPITVMDGSTNWTLTEKIMTYDVVQFTGTTPATYQAEVYDLITGEYEVMFGFCNQHDNDTDPNDTIWFNSSIFRDPRYVRVEVNNPRTYKAITVGKPHGISFEKDLNSVVEIVSPINETNAWTIHFLGIPDKLSFKPSGDKPWQIEESQDGITWTTTFTWATLPNDKIFEHSLMPSTQYLRINYAAGGTGIMANVVISKLEGVKFTPSKVYMPVEIDNNQLVSQSREVAITYVSSQRVTVASSIAGEFTFDQSSFNPTNAEPFYNVENLVITNANCRNQKLTGVNVNSSVGTEVIPVQTYLYPQELPIVLASDMPAERFYYVTTHTYNTIWNEDTRTMTMHNAVAKAQPYATFHFKGTPTYISFNHNADIAKGKWIVEESTDGINWHIPQASNEDVNNNTFFKKMVTVASDPAQSIKYIRVTYKSLYTCKIDVTDLRIIGEEGAFVNKTELTVEYVNETTNFEPFTVTAINLADGMRISTDNTHFTLSHGVAAKNQNFTLDATTDGGIYADIFKAGVLAPIDFNVYFDGTKAVDYATITITNNPEEGEEIKVFATIQVTGICKTLTPLSKFFTGVPDGTDGEGNVDATITTYTLKGDFEGSKYRPLSIANAFANDSPIFDYLYVFGETTTMDGTTTINVPTTLAGSNAKTPCYIYKKVDGRYECVEIVENANSGIKIKQDFLSLTAATSEQLKTYITGFCPYASTGYTKEDEGVFCFRGGAGDNVDVYLQDCYLFSRSKTDDGHYFDGRYDGNAFTEQYVRGSGGVLVFECIDSENKGNPFNVTIHTRDNNMFKSHYGCFLESMAGRAFQVSAPVQIHMATSDYIRASYTVLNFDDIWPNATTGADERTNGFISLQKQHNNAPSIDLGNPNTVVNFNGGRVELQNAGNVSDNYNSTLAISYRGGRFAGFFLAYGLGSDEVSGTVNFNDGTTTVIRMDVAERYRQYYLMDENGTTTSCLRTPKDTYVFGGSHCMMRACESATSKGGAPTDGKSALGKFEYKDGYTSIGTYGLVKPDDFPNKCYLDYYTNVDGYQKNAQDQKCYGLQSIAPVNGAINLWLPVLNCDDAFDVEPEKDQTISFWRACMTKIEAHYVAGDDREVGGDVTISFNKNNEQTELVSNLLYCKIDNSIRQIIKNSDYQAPVKNPMTTQDAEPYIYIKPTYVGEQLQHYVTNDKEYRIENKIYYITTAEADTWMTFTAPFDVKNIYVMEAYPESLLETYAQTHTPSEVRQEQAKYNANFAAFFGVAMCIHPNKTFDMIYRDFEGWAAQEYGSNDFGRQLIVPYNGSNFNESNAYIFRNDPSRNWMLSWQTDAEGYTDPVYTPNWERVVGHTEGKIMQQGETYSMLLPFCTGCTNRNFWDYWSGKFLIFESVDGPHYIKGGDFVATDDVDEDNEGDWLFEKMTLSSTEAILTGNSTFTKMTPTENVFSYYGDRNDENFYPTDGIEIEPTTAFLMALPPADPVSGMPAKAISRTGRIIYDKENTPTGNIPTVGGGNDLFITSTAEGINIAVAEPQHVRVMSATGVLLFNGMVQTAVDILLPTAGVYVVAGENEVHKILY